MGASCTGKRVFRVSATLIATQQHSVLPLHTEPTEKVPITAFLSIFSVTLFKNYRKRTLKILRSEVFQWPREKYGREQGEKAGIYKTAKNLKELGIDVGTIQKATGLSAEEIASL